MPRLIALALLLAACGGPPPPAETTADAIPEIAGPWAEHADLPRVRVPLDDAPARGASDPLVTLVVFTDFECPYCQTMAGVFDQLLAAHPDALRVVHRHLPLPMHPQALPAAMAVEEARAQRGDAGFWAMHDAIFGSPGDLSDATLLEHAQALELDLESFAGALRYQTHATEVEDDLMVADRVGARGTPTFFLNGRIVLGSLSIGDLEALYAEELALANDALERGIAREHLYAAAMRESLEQAPPRPTRRARARRRLDRRVIYDVPVRGRPLRGPVEAPVTIVMFSDFECPWCADVLPTLERLTERYPDQLRFVYRHNPLPSHRNARAAAAASLEAFAQQGDEGFWRMHDLLVENRRALSRHDLAVYAQELGLDVPRFEAAIRDGTHSAAIDEDMTLARRLGARSTPTFYVNGRVIEGAVDAPVFVIAIDDALERAQAALDEGAAADALYEALLDGAAEEAVYRGDP